MSNKIYTFETITEHQEQNGKALSFGEAMEILKGEGENLEKIATAYNLGYLRALEAMSEKKEA